MEFPKTREDVKLDIVGLLAIVGESAMSGHVQPSTASWTTLLPRLIPAPQSFLKTERPWRLPFNGAASVVGIRSGNFSQGLNFFPDVLHGIDHLPRFSVRTVSITRSVESDGIDGIFQNVTVRKFGPLDLLAFIGMMFFLGLLVAAVILRDGMAVCAVLLLSLTSSLVGIGSFWSVDLQRRRDSRSVPSGDVVVLGRQGSFIVVRCAEDIARELYFGQERCNYYLGERAFEVVAATATFMFMASVVFLANCTWNLQASIGMSYIILNGLYWMAALMPQRLQWDMSAYTLHDEGTITEESYTDTLINVIRNTRETQWIRIAGAVPKTKAWDAWLEEAGEKIMDSNWNGRDSLTKLLNTAPSTTVSLCTKI
ncbi:hypothetical protein BZA77DRAFT_254512 [Pyronema omphalodes]|nr:hypothetical protein BZA77DRAFT_254512 [Pyronema omphalodes]